MKKDEVFDRKRIRKNAWNQSFKRGKINWLLLVVVCFIFSFVGSSETEQTSFLIAADSTLGFNTNYIPQNVEVLETYVLNRSIAERIPVLYNELAVDLVNGLSRKHTWLINLLAANFAYFKRNPGEVIAVLVVVSLVSFAVNIFVQNTFNVGKARYFLESRCENRVKIKRIFAPFHKEDILHLTAVMIRCQLGMFLWAFTIIGYFYRIYQYRMIPYLLAENPKLSWKQAKRMAIKMTNGYKWKIFLTELASFHVYLLKAIPIAGLLIALPYEESLHAEIYSTLRRVVENDRTIFIEERFDQPVSLEKYGTEHPALAYRMKDVIADPKEIRKNIVTDIQRNHGVYGIYDYLFFFFSFSIAGWIWEVILSLIQFHELVNRGTMYGPWLPIYGMGGVIIIFLLDRFKTNKIHLFFLTAVVCGTLEYLSSWILDFFYNSAYWNYKGMLLNVNGRICLAGLMAFGLAGQVGIYLAAPQFSLFLDRLGKRKTRLLCVSLIVLFLIDGLCCLLFGFNVGVGIGGKY